MVALWLLSPPVHAFGAGTGQAAAPAAAPAPAPDVITFTNGDQLTGKLLHAANGTVTFHSDIAGDINVTWDKIKSVHSSQPFAVIQKGQEVSEKTPDSEVPQGAIDVEDQQVHVNAKNGGGEKTIPAANTQYVIDDPTYVRDVRGHPGFREGWAGGVTAGASQVIATQNSRSFTVAANGVRNVPNASWLDPRSRSIFNFTSAYGSLTQPNTPETKTNIIHGDAEQDWYLSPRFYLLATLSLDHNYSQGLDLQQIYGGGAGVTVFKSPKQELDLKADIHYERQSFGFTPGITPPVGTPSKSLIGIDGGDTYIVKLPYKMVFNQSLVVTPAFNDIHAFSAIFIAGLTFPIYKHFGFTVGALDDFLNDPAAGSKRNSFQYTGGLTYSF